MWERFRWSGWVVSAALLIFTCAAGGDEPKSSPPAGKQVPESKAKLTLDEVLRNWQQAQSKIDRLDARFSSIVYDEVFEAAIVGQGLVSVDRDERCFFELKPYERIEDNTDNKKVERGSKVYRRTVAHNQRWHWTGTSIIKVDEASRTYECLMIPLEHQGRTHRSGGNHTYNPRPAPPPLPEDVSPPTTAEQPAKIQQVSGSPVLPKGPEKIPAHRPTLLEAIGLLVYWATCWSTSQHESNSDNSNTSYWTYPVFELYWARPFLLDPRPDELRSRYLITLTKQSATEVRLEFEPQDQLGRAQCRRVYLILDRHNYQPKALKIDDPTGNKSQVFVFTDVRINQRPIAPFGDLGEPDLKEYECINCIAPAAWKSSRQ